MANPSSRSDAVTAAEGPVVILGAGQAGGWVAATLADRAPGLPVILLGDEGVAPYERPPLSKGILAGKAAPDSAALRAPGYWAAAGVDLRTQARVTAIDRAARRVTLADGGTLAYGTLVIATGCAARPLPAPVEAGAPVFALRTLDDALALKVRLMPGAHVVAVGAGFIGLEVAATAVGLGCTVTVVEKAPQALGRVLDGGVAAALVDLHRARGVALRFGVGVAAVQGGAQGARVVLEDGGTLAADVVVAGVGAAPRTGLAQAAGLACDDGILTDAFGRSSDPHIWAAGDVTRQENPLIGRALRLESWQNAQAQGIAVGRALAGDPAPLAEVPWFWTDQHDVNLQMAGAPLRRDRVIWRGSPAEGKFSVLYLDGARVVAGNTWNAARDMRPIRQLIASGADVSAAGLDDMGQSLTAICRTVGAA